MYKTVIILVFLILIIVRFINLGKIPIFIDEQTYLNLGRNFIQNPHTLFSSLKYLVFPVVPWILGITQYILGPFLNVLVIGRASMVLADIISAFVIYLIANEMYGKRYGIISAVIYLSLPLNFFHSRVILLEPITNMFSILGLLFYIKYFYNKKPKKPKKLIIALFTISILLLLSFLSKPIALVSFSSIPILALFSFIGSKKHNLRSLINITIPLFAIFLILLIISSPFVFTVWREFSDYRVGANLYELVHNCKKNIWLAWWWSKTYVSLPIIIACIISFIYALISKNWKVSWVFCWLAIALLMEMLIGTNFFPRHLFLIAPPIALTTAFIIHKISVRFQFVAVLILLSILFICWQTNIHILINPQKAPIALEDKQQFFEDWTSGMGLSEIASDLRLLSKEKKIITLVEPDGGFGWALTHIYNTGNTTIRESQELDQSKSELLLQKSLTKDFSEVYIILNRNTEPPDSWNLELISKYPKASSKRYMKIYKHRTS